MGEQLDLFEVSDLDSKELKPEDKEKIRRPVIQRGDGYFRLPQQW